MLSDGYKVTKMNKLTAFFVRLKKKKLLDLKLMLLFYTI